MTAAMKCVVGRNLRDEISEERAISIEKDDKAPQRPNDRLNQQYLPIAAFIRSRSQAGSRPIAAFTRSRSQAGSRPKADIQR
jgi:hypothetical protein